MRSECDKELGEISGECDGVTYLGCYCVRRGDDVSDGSVIRCQWGV